MEWTRKLFKVKGVFTSSYHPQTDGATERMNQTITHMLRFLVDERQDNWDECLPNALYAYNTTPCNRSTDFTPYFTLFGRHAASIVSFKLPPLQKVPANMVDYVTNLTENMLHAQEVAAENIRVQQETNKKNYDKRKNTKEAQFKVGDKVFLHLEKPPKKLSRKLSRPWVGPYYIDTCKGKSTFTLRKIEDSKRIKAPVNVDRLKKCIDPSERPTETPTIESEIPDLANEDMLEDDVVSTNGEAELDQIENNDFPEVDDSKGTLDPADIPPSDPTEEDKEMEEVIGDDIRNNGSETVSDTTEEKKEIEKVIGYDIIGDRRVYRIKWKGLDNRHNRWVPEENLNEEELQQLVIDDPPRLKKKKKRKKRKRKF